MKERKQKTLGKRLLVAMLSVMMTVTFIPTSLFAYAAEPEVAPDDVQNDVQTEVVQDNAQNDEPQTETTEVVKEEATKATEAQQKQEAKEDESEKAATTHFSKELDEIIVDVDTEDGAFDEDVSLKVAPIAEGSKEYKKAEKALAENEQTYAGMLAFDIHFENSKGSEVEPDGTVSVKLTAKKEAFKGIAVDSFDANSVQITHIGDNATEVVADTDKKSEIEGTVAVEVGKKAVKKVDAEFDVEKFSTFALTWEDGEATIHWGELDDGEFKEFEHAILDTSAASVSLENNFDGFSCYGAVYKETEDDTGFGIGMQLHKTDAGWEMDKIVGDGEITHYEKAAIADGSHIYVYYGAKQERPSSEDNPTVHGPTTTKTVTNNDDDTCTIQLDITAPVIHEEDKVGANVIVVLDTTRSMSYNMAGDQTSGVPRDQMRMEAARAALVTLVNSLNMGPNDINFALAEFNLNGSTHSWGQGNWTKSADTVLGYVEGRTQGGGYQLDYTTTTSGTNWEIGLRQGQGLLTQAETNDELKNNKTYVIFVTDGDPNRWVGYNYGNNDYTHNAEAVEHAQDEANDIVKRGAYLYGVFCGSSAGEERLETLIDTADGVDTISAGSKEAIQAAFQSIAHTIVSDLGSSQVSIDDGVTELSSVSAQVSGPTGGYEYYKKGPNDSDFVKWSGAPGASFSDDNGVTWDLSDVGTLEANTTYRIKFKVWPSQAAYDLIANLNNETQKISDTDITDDVRSQLTVKIGSTTYEFDSSTKRWKPSNDSSSEGVTSAQLQTMIESSNNVEYNLKTNTHLNTSYDYNGVSYTDVVKDVPNGSMLLESELMIVQKMFAHSINAQDPFTSIMFYLKEDGKYYQKDGTTSETFNENKVYELPVNTDNDWKNTVYIAPGFAEVNTDGTLEILEPGHNYTLEEKVLEGSEYEYEFTPQTVRPMVIEGHLTYLILKDKYNTPPSGATVYKIGDADYFVAPAGNQGKLIGTNRKTAELDITKVVETNGILTDEQEAEESFTYRVTLNIPDGADPAGIVGYEYVYRPTQDNAYYLYGYHQYSEEGEPAPTAFEDDIARLGNNKYRAWNTLVYRDLVEWENVDGKIVSKRDADGNIIWKVPAVDGYHTITYDMTLKQNEVIRFTNLPSGTTYTIQEIYANKYPADNVGGQTSGRTPVSDPSNIADEGYGITVKKTSGDVTQTAVANDTVSGEIKDLDIRYYNQFTNTMTKTVDVNLEGVKALEGYNWSGESYHFTLTGGENAPMPAEATGKTAFDLTDTSGNASKTDSFGRLRFTQAGTYTYTVTENNAGTVQTINGKKILFDTPKTIEIEVVADDGGNLSVESVTGDGVEWNADTSTASVTLTNRYNETSVPVTKVWEDVNNQDGIRPDSVTINLLADDEQVDSVDLDGEETPTPWKHTFTGLDKYKIVDGAITPIEYTVEEVETDVITGTDGPGTYAYAVTGDATSGYTVTNTHTPETTEATVKKVWDDAEDQDGKRPETLTVTLSNGQTVTLSANNNWEATITGLPKYAGGVEIEYSWTEDLPDGYTLTGNVTEGTITTLTNTHSTEKVSVPVEKVWEDAKNQDGIRPDEVKVNLLADGTAVSGKQVTLNQANSWKYTWTGLDKYRDGGTEIEYTVKEVETDVITGTDGPGTYAYAVTGDATSGYTVTNTHTPEKVSVPVKKVWEDANNQDGIRPDGVAVNLLADGTAVSGKQVTLNQANSWKYTWTGLDKYKDGKEIKYTVKEVETDVITGTDGVGTYAYAVTGDATSGYTVTNTHTPEETEATVVKVWDDADNQDGKRPETLTVTLSNGTKDVGTVTLSDDNEWTDTIDRLPKYADGVEIEYSWTEETLPEGYALTNTEKKGTVTTFTNSYKPKEREATVKKVWDDADNQDGKRPETLTVTLSNGTKDVGTVTLSDDNEWTDTITGLPVYAGGQEITYTWTEETLPEGYTLTGNVTEGTITTLTNSYTPEKVSVPVKKVWEDANNQDGIRPDGVAVNLLADGTAVSGKQVTLNQANSWKYTWTGLDKYKDGGKEIKYTVKEVETDVITGTDGPGTYAYAVTGDAASGYTVTNTHTPEKVSVPVKKVWSDADNQDGVRPEEVKVDLLADGTAVSGQQTTLNKANTWKHTWTELDKYKDGKEIKYTVKEVETDVITGTDGPGTYAYAVTGDATSGYTVTNTHTPEKVSVPVEKVWSDAENQDGIRPDEVKVDLLADGTAVSGKQTTLNEANTWKYTWTGLDKYKDGKEIKYTVKEVETDVITGTDGVGTYAYAVTGDAASGYIVTNTHTPEKVSVPVKKVWKDADNQDGIRPDEVKVDLLADGTAVSGKQVALNQANSWAYTWTELDKYKDGKEIKYTVKEVETDVITGTDGPGTYAYAVTGDATSGYTVTNTHTPETTKVIVDKVWEDNDDEAGKRPQKVTVTLNKKPVGGESEVVETVELNASNEWHYEWPGLDVYQSGSVGVAMEYTVDEAKVEGYDGDVETEKNADGNYEVTVTNTFREETAAEPAVIKIHKVDQDGASLKGATFTLTNEDGTKTLSDTTDDAGLATITIPVAKAWPQDGTVPEAEGWLGTDERVKAKYEFTLEETTAPEGHDKADPSSWTVTVTPKKSGEGYDIDYDFNEDNNLWTRIIKWFAGTLNPETEGDYTLVAENPAKPHEVTVTKTFDGITPEEAPKDFAITVNYIDNDKGKATKPLTLTVDMESTDNVEVEKDGNKVTWTVKNVRYGTEFKAVETGYQDEDGIYIVTRTVAPSTTTAPGTPMVVPEGTDCGGAIVVPDTDDAHIDFTNKYEYHELVITKKVPTFINHEGQTSTDGGETNVAAGASFVFHVEGYAGNTKILDTYTGIDLSKPGMGEAKLGRISGKVDKVKVTEVYTGNYNCVVRNPRETVTLIDGDNAYMKYFQLDFENNWTGKIEYKTGVTNQYSNSDEGPVIRGETQAGGDTE